MNSETKLDNRLRLCAGFVRHGSRVADIGTDHAYLPVWLCRNGVCPSAIAADINPEPLARGAETVILAGLTDKIETRLSDGLSEIGENEVDDIVIAGMGGELIARILENCPYSKNSEKHFVLQPMTKCEELIKRLCANGFEIIEQDCCTAGGKNYTVLSVKYTGAETDCDGLFCYTGRLNPQNEAHLRYLKGCISRLKKQARGDARFGALAKELEEFCNEN